MAFFRAALLRAAASNSPSLASRTVGRRACYSSAAVLRPGPRGIVPRFGMARGDSRLCTMARDSILLRVINDEIKCAEESDDHNQVIERPDNFPFGIKDEHGTNTIVLTRNFHGEDVEVVVSMPSIVTGDNPDVDGGGGDGDQEDEGPVQSSIPLIIKVSKGSVPSLEFCCTAYADEIGIDSLAVKEGESTEEDLAYEGPEFSDLDENLQKAFHKYLEIRGISPGTTNFLHEYMLNKDSQEYLQWLKNLKSFISK